MQEFRMITRSLFLSLLSVVLVACGPRPTRGIYIDTAAPSGLTYSTNPAVYTKGQPIPNNNPSSSGGAVASFAVTPALPEGLSLDTSSGIISGTPTTLSALSEYTVTATNAGGSTTATLTLTVNDVPPSGLTYSANPVIYAVGHAIPNNTPSSSGGAVVSYAVSPALLEGLSLDANTGVISGTPAAVSPETQYTVTATNSGGSTTATVTISVTVTVVGPSTLTYSDNPAVYTLGQPITNNTPSSTGGAVVAYTITPFLPAGLNLDANTGVISGTPAMLSPLTEYTVTAANSGGSTTATLTLTVNDVPPSALTYSANPAVYTKGQAIPNNTPSSSGGAVVSYAVSPALPPGLSLDTMTGVIAGTPTTLVPLANYTVTATNSGGSTTATLTLTVNDVPPFTLVYSANPAVYTKGQAIPNNTPSISGVAVVSYAVSPPLPAGLSLDARTGVISGTPTVLSPARQYTVTAANSGGSITATLTLTVNDVPPSALVYSANPAVYTKGQAIPNNTPSSSGGAVVSYAVEPALPAGLRFDPTSGIISGTPTVLSPATSYTVTATNSGGSTNATLQITVNDLAPTNLVYTTNPAVYFVGEAITPNRPSSGGGAVISYSIYPPLPAGLSLDTSTGVITGTPQAPTTAANYAVSAINSGGTATANLTITVRPPICTRATEFGGLPAVPAGSYPNSVAMGDLNGDGKLDLAVANSGSNTVSVLLSRGNGTFAANVDYATAKGPWSVAVGDLNGDGKPDLATANYNNNTVSVFLNQGNGTFATKVDYAAGAFPWSVAVGDLNGDGKSDLAVVNSNGNTVSVLLNKGNGVFATKVDYATGSSPRQIAVGDLNGDGKPDLAVANESSNTVSVLLNNGDGTFTTRVDYATGATPRAVAMADINGDGKADLAVANSGSDTASVLLNNGNGTFASKVDYATGIGPQSVAMGDLNGDGKVDLAVANSSNSNFTVSVLLNNDNGTFAPKVDYGTGGNPISLAMGDLNGDGKPDLATASNNGSSTVSVLLNNGSGTFATRADSPTGTNPTSVAVGDLNGDGTPDLAVTNYFSNAVSVLLNNGSGTFATKVDYTTGANPQSVAIADINGDGKADLAMANFGASTVSVLLNQGNGTFAARVDYPTGTYPRSVAVGDLNGDGKPDLATANYSSGTVSVLLNQGNGTFATHVDYATGYYPQSVAMGDLNGDGKADLAVVNSSNGSYTVSVLLNNGNGTFATHVDYVTGTNPQSVAMADLNGDGKLDLAVANSGRNTASVLLNNGNGTFAAKVDYATGVSPNSVVVSDLDGDGKPDLAVANAVNSVSVLLNDGNGTFVTHADYAASGNAVSVAVGDLNGDGKLDLAVANNNLGTVGVLLQDGCPR